MHTATKPRTLAAALMTALLGGTFQAKPPAVRGQRGATRLGNTHPVDRNGQHRNPIRAERRALVAAIGRRQAVKQIKRERRAAIASVQASV